MSIIKRVFDVVSAVVLLSLLFPLMLVVALLVKLDGTSGPVFSDSPKRVGRNGKSFVMYKFRTMIPDAHQKIREDPEMKKLLQIQNSSQNKIKSAEDTRITKIGRFIRMFDMDELPQLINVIKGEMSIVGPRPYFSEELNKFACKKVNAILSINPGITGLWQVSGRNELTINQRLKLDLDYVQNLSLVEDLKILFKTPSVVLTRKGAW